MSDVIFLITCQTVFLLNFQETWIYCGEVTLIKADIRNPLRYLLMNRSRFQRLLSRGFKPLLRQSTFGPPPTPLRRRGGGLIVRFKPLDDYTKPSVFFE